MIPPSDFLLQLTHFLREKLHGTATLGADHVVMAAAIVLVFVTSDAIVKRDFAGKSAFCQQLQGPVNGCISNAGVFFLDKPVQFIGGQMIASFEKRTQDGIALCGLLEAYIFQVPVQDVLGLANHLARDRGLIVDAFLQRLRHAASQNTIQPT